MLRHLRNLIGNLRGYSGCLHCGDRWNWKKEHSIKYEQRGQESSAMFPICEECFQKLPVEGANGIMHYCNELLTQWIAFSRARFPPERVSNMLICLRENVEIDKSA